MEEILALTGITYAAFSLYKWRSGNNSRKIDYVETILVLLFLVVAVLYLFLKFR